MSSADSSEPQTAFKEIVIQSSLAEAKRPESLILDEVARAGYREDDVFAIKLALEEAMTNAVRHGNRGDATKRVFVRYAVSPSRTTIAVRDEGPGFCPDDVPDPTLPGFIERPCGRGIMLMRAYMSHVEYRENGTEVVMTKLNEQ